MKDEVVPDAHRRQGRAQWGTVYLQNKAPQLPQVDEEAAAGPAGGTQDAAESATQQLVAKMAQSHHNSMSQFIRGAVKSLGKFMFYNTQIEIQSFMLVCIWTKASEGLGWGIALVLLPPLLVVCILASVVWCRLLQHLLGCRSIWLKEGDRPGQPARHSVWSIRTGMSTGERVQGLDKQDAECTPRKSHSSRPQALFLVFEGCDNSSCNVQCE
jgi:hypothetical protein